MEGEVVWFAQVGTRTMKFIIGLNEMLRIASGRGHHGMTMLLKYTFLSIRQDDLP